MIERNKNQEFIIRQNSVSNACMLCSNGKIELKYVLKQAAEFERWVLREDNLPISEITINAKEKIVSGRVLSVDDL